MKTSKKISALILALTMCIITFAGCSHSKKNDDGGYKIAVVPKLTSANWFVRMESGVKAYNEAHGTDYFYGGPTDATDQAAYSRAPCRSQARRGASDRG